MSWKGPRGPRVFGGMEYVDELADEIRGRFNVPKEDILIGFMDIPPQNIPCRIYVRLQYDSAEYYYQKDGEWVNWNYEE